MYIPGTESVIGQGLSQLGSYGGQAWSKLSGMFGNLGGSLGSIFGGGGDMDKYNDQAYGMAGDWYWQIQKPTGMYGLDQTQKWGGVFDDPAFIQQNMAYLQGQMGRGDLSSNLALYNQQALSNQTQPMIDQYLYAMGLDNNMKGMDQQRMLAANSLLPAVTQNAYSNIMNDNAIRSLDMNRRYQQDALTGASTTDALNNMARNAQIKDLDLQNKQFASQLTPGLANLTSGRIQSEGAQLPMQTAVGNELLYNQGLALAKAREGVNAEDWMGQARSDVAQGFKSADSSMRREAMRMGLDPNSSQFQNMIKSSNMDQAKAIGGAMNQARRAADTESYNRLMGSTQMNPYVYQANTTPANTLYGTTWNGNPNDTLNQVLGLKSDIPGLGESYQGLNLGPQAQTDSRLLGMYGTQTPQSYNPLTSSPVGISGISGGDPMGTSASMGNNAANLQAGQASGIGNAFGQLGTLALMYMNQGGGGGGGN